jgi:hypothetical protein
MQHTKTSNDILPKNQTKKTEEERNKKEIDVASLVFAVSFFSLFLCVWMVAGFLLVHLLFSHRKECDLPVL